MVSVYVRMTETRGKKGSAEVRKLLGKALCLQYPDLGDIWEKGLPAMEKNAFGKPYFPGYPGIYFNLSHTEGCVCCALADAPVGVDVELCRPRKNPGRIVGRFSATEQRLWRETPKSRQEEVFFALWVLKESCVKADGRGLRIPLDAFSVEPAGRPEERKENFPKGEWTAKINVQEQTGAEQAEKSGAEGKAVCYYLHLYTLKGPYQIAACCERAGFSGPFLVE